jgi:DnaK suppressor protein
MPFLQPLVATFGLVCGLTHREELRWPPRFGSGAIIGAGVVVLSAKKRDHFKQLLETRIAELERVLVTTEREARASEAKHADPADQAASEYERQSLAHKAASTRHTLKALKEALRALQEGRFGECAECGGDIELKRLEAIPWARYCIRCQEAREQQ